MLETDRLVIKMSKDCTIDDFEKVHEYDFNYLMDINGIFEYVKRNPGEVSSWFNNDLEAFYKKIDNKNNYNFIVFLKDGNKPIGNIGFDRYDEKMNSLEISAYLHPSYWGNDYMKEAILCLMEYIFEKNYDNIVAGYYEGNNKSRKLIEKLGFIEYKSEIDSDFLGNETIVHDLIMSKDRFYELINKQKNVYKK